MKIYKNHSTISENKLSMHHWNVAGALHNPKGHVSVSKVFKWTSERGLLPVLYSNRDLIVPQVTIQKIVVLVTS